MTAQIPPTYDQPLEIAQKTSSVWYRYWLALKNIFTTTDPGLVPPPGTVTGKLLRDDGTWVTVSGTGTVTSVGLSSTDLSVSGSPVISAGSITANIAAGAVTNTKLANMAADTVKGTIAGGTPSDLSQTQLTSLVNTFTSVLSGAVPASGGGTTTYLRADGTFAAPAGGGSGTAGPAIFLDADPGEDGPPGPPGPVGATGTQGLQGIQGPQGVAVYLEADGIDGDQGPPGPPGVAGAAGGTGAQGPMGPAVYLETDGADGDIGPPGPPGTAGVAGNTGAQGPAGPAVYLEVEGLDGDPGAPGPAGVAGSTGSQGPAGPAVYLEADSLEGDPGPPGASGPAGAAGSTGAQGPAGVPIYLEAQDGEDALWGPPGNQGAQGATGAAGPAGPAVFLDALDPEEPMYFQGPQGNAGQNLAYAGALVANTTINDNATYTTGGVTLAAQVAGAGSVWRVRAMGTFVAVSSATARNAQIACFWGSTQLVSIAVVVLVSVAQTTNWVAEFILTGVDTTHIWTAGWVQNKFDYPAIVAGTSSADKTDLATPASTAVTAGAQTVDLRFSMSVAVATDQWVVQNVTMERLK